MLSVYVSMTTFEKNILEMYGEQAQKWLGQLPDMVTFLAREWGLSNLLVVNNLSYNFVMSGKQGGKDIILKFGLERDEIHREALALQAFSGHGCAKLLNFNKQYNAILMEMVLPGHSLKSLFPHQDDEAIDIACQIISDLHEAPIPASETFPTLEDWLSLFKETGRLSSPPLKKASIQIKYLLESAPRWVLLHGDLHHDNILSQGNKGWVAIDPKGVVGDPGFEASVFIYNPITELYDHPEIKEIIAKRIKLFAQHLDYSEQRLRDWTYVRAVLAACWAVEDNLSPKKFLHFIEIVDQL